ncbi:MAG TPA: hypothetical protein VKA58_10550 [Propionibacteriaceae bacterium]|nr:hypothetical protein [Propionibacteriaceae bacterium]
MAVPLPGPMYVTVGSTSEPPRGFTWRVWPSRTSFYLKSRAPGMGLLKLSIHGDDPRHPGLAGFKIGMDSEDQYQAAVTAGEIGSIRSGDWPMWFPGKDIGHNALLVVRLRWTWDACMRLPPAPPPGELKKDAVGLVAPSPPGPGDAVDVDLIVAFGKPYWLRERKARADNAVLGPLRNDADLWLTGTVVKRVAAHRAPPPHAVGPVPTGRQDEVRGLAATVDPEGFLWLIEQRMSRSALTATADEDC